MRAELIIYGFIRIHFPNYNSIPKELQELCLLMYLVVMDEWDAEKAHANVSIDATDNTATYPGTTGWKQAVGSMIIKTGEIRTWKIKITEKSNLLVGIAPSTQVSGFFVENADSFAIHSQDGSKISRDEARGGKRYSQRLKQMDIVSITLDLTDDENGTLSYKINDKDFGIAFEKLRNDISYCLVVSGFEHSQVQLLQ